MAVEIAERAFEPYFTTKNSNEHSGLGLSQVYGYAKQSGGHARIDSEPGRGTTVQLFLPRFADASPARQAMPKPNPGRGETVLLVEDAPLVRNAAAKMLVDLGYRPIAAADAEEGLALVEAEGRIELLLTDMMLPGGMGGEELAVAARRLRPGLRVLYMSGCAGIRLSDAAGEGGRYGFIAKPFSKAQLAAQLRAVIDGEAAAAA